MENTQLTPVHENLIKLRENLEELHSFDEFTDIVITCEDQIFKCRSVILAAASGFFRAIFNSDFLEGRSRNVNLSFYLSARIFCEVVHFIYEGHILVNIFNVNDLLQASELLQINEIERLCVEFVETYKISAEKTLEMFVFACRTGKERLIDILSTDIAEHMKIFSAIDSFLELSVSDLKTIVERWSSLGAFRQPPHKQILSRNMT